jgi:uncharacterized membrane protein
MDFFNPLALPGASMEASLNPYPHVMLMTLCNDGAMAMLADHDTAQWMTSRAASSPFFSMDLLPFTP